jgi:hypothetical protein
MKSIPARAEVAPEGVGAVGEDVAGPVLALVVVRHVTACSGTGCSGRRRAYSRDLSCSGSHL